MVENAPDKLDLIFHALSDATRRALLIQLTKQEANVTQLAAPYDQTFAGIAKHLKVLEDAGLVEKSKAGRSMVCKAKLEPLRDVYSVLEELGEFWRGRLDALELFLANEITTTEKKDGKRTRSKSAGRGNGKKDNLR